MLYILTQLNNLDLVLNLLEKEDAILFIHDASYVVLNTDAIFKLKVLTVPLYLLSDDLSARGLTMIDEMEAMPMMQVVHFSDVVQITAQHSKSVTF